MRNGAAILIMLLAVTLSACHSDIIYSRFVPMKPGSWHMDSVARFDYPVTDAAPSYRVLLYVRHKENYPYQNMWLFVENAGLRDTIEFYLADDRGRWLGDKHHGFIEMPVLYEDHLHFPDTGVYHMEVRHGMRDSLLRGVTDVGVEIIRNN